jgi:type I restriction enzyme S subunit
MRVQTKKVSDLFADVKIGGTPSRGNPAYFSGGNLWVSIRDMEGQPLITRTAETISDEGARNSNCKLIKEGSLLFSFKLTVGRTAFAGVDLYTNEAIAAFDRNEAELAGIDLEYLSLVLPIAASGDTTKNSMGAALLNKDKILNLKIPVLAIDDQRQIAARLKAQLTEVETARQAARVQLRDANFLRQRLLRQTFDALDDLPRKVLGEWATTTSGSTPSRGDKRYWSPAEIPWVKTGEVAFAPITRTEEAISRQALAECSLTLLPPQTLLIAMYGQGKTRGQSAVLEIEATTNQACFAIFPNDTWDVDFLHHWLMASYEDLRSLSDGRGGNQANLNGGLLSALEVPAPDIHDQRRIVTHLKQQLAEADALRAALEQQLRDLDALPQRILAQAFEN